jgi:N-glycosylase/DNA lyase
VKEFLKKIKNVQKSPVAKRIQVRLKEFEDFKNKSEEEWFGELCFCILAANAKALSALELQREIGKGFLDFSEAEIRKRIRAKHHRFHNNKTRFIIEARKHKNLKKTIQGVLEVNEEHAREWLVENVLGIGYKEASHFLRNVGAKNLAILDRHILATLIDEKFLQSKPKSLTENEYKRIEKIFQSIAKEAKMSPAELDMYIFYMKKGVVLK